MTYTAPVMRITFYWLTLVNLYVYTCRYTRWQKTAARSRRRVNRRAGSIACVSLCACSCLCPSSSVSPSCSSTPSKVWRTCTCSCRLSPVLRVAKDYKPYVSAQIVTPTSIYCSMMLNCPSLSVPSCTLLLQELEKASAFSVVILTDSIFVLYFIAV